MFASRVRLLALLLISSSAVSAVRAADPKDNPVATFYSGPEGYPAWTDDISWGRVINMKTYPKGKTVYAKFQRACRELSASGGVLYYPAGTYDFAGKPVGVGLGLPPGVVIRGEAPGKRTLAATGKLVLPTKFVFAYRNRVKGGKVPSDWNFISLAVGEGTSIKTGTDRVGIAWVHFVGASIYFGPDVDWGNKTWGTAVSPVSDQVKKIWAVRPPDGSHPFDVPASGSKKYRGAGKGRLVFGCVLEDAAVLDDFSDPGYGPHGFTMMHYGGRITVYGSRVLVANNLLPRSRKNFRYRQMTDKGERILLYDHGRTCGIDINKDLLASVREGGACAGYFEEGVVVRDNYVFNHGHTGYNVAGNWVTITGNNNDRVFLRQGDRAYGLGPWTLTLDGFEVAGPKSDNRSRAFDLAGKNLWVDGNRFTNTGSSPGKDGEGIVGRGQAATPVFSWAITHNIHTRGVGAGGGLGGLGADCHGLLIAWNKTPGWVGNAEARAGTKMTDCVFLPAKSERVLPDRKTIARLGLKAPLTASPADDPAPPTKVTASAYQQIAIKVAWVAPPDPIVGFRVERRIGEGKWQVIAYRPPRLQGDADNPQMWLDFTAPRNKKLTYRVVAVNGDDSNKGASAASEGIMLGRQRLE